MLLYLTQLINFWKHSNLEHNLRIFEVVMLNAKWKKPLY